MIFALTALTGTLAILLVATVAAFLVAFDRAEQRHAAERDKDRDERQLLLNRIQAPETAVAQSLPDPVIPVTALDPDNDADFWKHVEQQSA
jgi:hypothetical protein